MYVIPSQPPLQPEPIVNVGSDQHRLDFSVPTSEAVFISPEMMMENEMQEELNPYLVDEEIVQESSWDVGRLESV